MPEKGRFAWNNGGIRTFAHAFSKADIVLGPGRLDLPSGALKESRAYGPAWLRTHASSYRQASNPDEMPVNTKRASDC